MHIALAVGGYKTADLGVDLPSPQTTLIADSRIKGAVGSQQCKAVWDGTLIITLIIIIPFVIVFRRHSHVG